MLSPGADVVVIDFGNIKWLAFHSCSGASGIMASSDPSEMCTVVSRRAFLFEWPLIEVYGFVRAGHVAIGGNYWVLWSITVVPIDDVVVACSR